MLWVLLLFCINLLRVPYGNLLPLCSIETAESLLQTPAWRTV
jgi:hypothetical protein